MTFIHWMTAIGVLLMIMALASGLIDRLPITTALIYLAVGIGIGPFGLGWLRVDFLTDAGWILRLTEVAVIVSLFIGGLKLRLPLRDPAWVGAFRLAGPMMLLCIAGVAIVAHGLLELSWPLAILLGAILAPTDPVLASMISVDDASDHDRMRYGLSGEAGLNDGMAFPFVALALLLMENGTDGAAIGQWALLRLLWAVPAGLAIGYVMGRALGWAAIRLQAFFRNAAAPSEFLALALIALAYSAAEAVAAWGFLAVFTAGLGLRHTEVAIVCESPHPKAQEGQEGPDAVHPPAEALVAPYTVTGDALAAPSVAAGVIVAESLRLGQTLERLMEALLLILVGVTILSHWHALGAVLALLLFLLVRPLTAVVALSGTPALPVQRWLMGWFGIRGIGSLYYLAYALTHGLHGSDAATLVDVTLTVIALSVLLHGASAQPLLAFYRRYLQRKFPARPDTAAAASAKAR